MKNPIFNLCTRCGASPTSTRLMASSLLLGLFATAVTIVNTQPSTARLVAPSQTVAQANNINNQLTGMWQTASSNPGAPPIRFIFGSDGKMYIIFPSSSGRSQAFDLRYRVNPAARPMQMDIIAGNQTAQTIFEFTPDRKMRVQLQGINAGRPRPSGFAANVTTMQKVNSSTALPANTQVVQPRNGIPLR
jgi:hypothetical protein